MGGIVKNYERFYKMNDDDYNKLNRKVSIKYMTMLLINLAIDNATYFYIKNDDTTDPIEIDSKKAMELLGREDFFECIYKALQPEGWFSMTLDNEDSVYIDCFDFIGNDPQNTFYRLK